MPYGHRGKPGNAGKESGKPVQATSVSPGKRALTGKLPPVQARGPVASPAEQSVVDRAAEGVGAGYGSPIPHLDAIQSAFGRHDVSQVEAHVGGAAADAAADIGAEAYATGNQVAFARSPDLHTAAHEAAHVVQQRGGVQLKDGVGRSGDVYERHADAVADRVVKGESAEGLLDEMAGSSPASSGAVQKRGDGKTTAASTAEATTSPTSTSTDAGRAGGQPFEESLCGLLERSVGAGDEQAIQGRKKALVAAFRGLSPAQRAALLSRLTNPARGDRLAELFEEKLATATRRSLLAILRDQPEAETAAPESAAPTSPAAGPESKRGEEDTWRAMLGESSSTVGKMGRVEAPKGLRLHAGPAAGSPTLAILPFDTLVHVERKTAHGWYYVASLGDSRQGSVTGSGCVEGRFVELDPPEPTAHLHHVQSGEMLKDIAAQYYKPKHGFEWGSDARLYVEAIWEANKSTGKLLRAGGGDLSAGEKLVRSSEQEKTQAIWRSVQPKANHAIWIPSQTFVSALEKQGAISSGSISNAAWEGAKEAVEAFVDFVQYAAGYQIGVLEGAFAAARDLVMGVVDLGELLYDLIKSLITEGLIGTAQSIGKKLVEAFKNAPALLKQAGTWFANKWTQADDFSRGEFHGEVVGYILLQVVIAIVTAGGSAALQAAGRFAGVVKVIRGLDAAGDIFTFARGAAKVARLPAAAVTKLRKAGGRAADAIDAASDGSRRAGHVEGPAPLEGPGVGGDKVDAPSAGAAPNAKVSPRAAQLADELTDLLQRDPDAFIARYRQAVSSLQPDELAALKNLIRERGRVTAAMSNGLNPKQIVELHRKRVICLREIGEFEAMSFHGTGSSMLDGLAKTDGEILPAADLAARNVDMSTGEGPKFTPRGGHKDFVSIGQGESGFGTSLAYADLSKGVAHYNPQLLSDVELKSKIDRLEYVLANYDSVKVDAPGPYGMLANRDREHFTMELSKLRREMDSRKGLPADSPRRLGGHSDPDNHPVLFEFDLSGMEMKVERVPRQAGGALGGEASVHGAIDLKKRVRRVYVPAAQVQKVSQKLQGTLGHANFEVIALEAVDDLPSPGLIGSSRAATYKGLEATEKEVEYVERAWEAAIREKRTLDISLLIEQRTKK
jgi:hypothetical protein